MLKLTQKIDGTPQEDVNIVGTLTQILKLLRRRTFVPSYAIYDLTKNRFCRFETGGHLIELDIEEVAPEELEKIKEDRLKKEVHGMQIEIKNPGPLGTLLQVSSEDL